MKIIQRYWCLFMVLSICFTQEILPLTQRYFHTEDMGYNYSRGTYLIVLAHASLKPILEDETTGDFIYFKKSQGYNVHVVNIEDIGVNTSDLKDYLEFYYAEDPLLEYVLLVGDVDHTYKIPSFLFDSYSDGCQVDPTDYNYTFFDDNDLLSPKLFIGRWSIRTEDELEKIKRRSIGYVTMNFPGADQLTPLDPSYLNNALMVAGNYGGPDIFPVTPVMTSQWLMDELYNYGYTQVDTAFWQEGDQIENPIIEEKWNAGVGIVGYRGWGGPTGWHRPEFRTDTDPGLSEPSS